MLSEEEVGEGDGGGEGGAPLAASARLTVAAEGLASRRLVFPNSLAANHPRVL